MNLLPLLNSILGARPKRHLRAGRFLGGGSGSFLNTSTLLTAAGLAAGAYEIYRTRAGASGSAATTTTVVGGTPSAPPPPRVDRVDIDGPRRVVQLALSAARADGTLGEEEYAQILAEARKVGMEPLVTAEFGTPRALPDIVAGVRDPKEKADLYALAFTIVRADEDVLGAERVYLAQLASALALDVATVRRVEKEIAERIDRAE